MPLAILVLPADMAQKDKDSYQTLIYNLTQANGMRFQVLNSLTANDLALAGPALKVVIAFPPDPGLAALTAAAPGVQFLAVGIPNLANSSQPVIHRSQWLPGGPAGLPGRLHCRLGCPGVEGRHSLPEG